MKWKRTRSKLCKRCWNRRNWIWNVSKAKQIIPAISYPRRIYANCVNNYARWALRWALAYYIVLSSLYSRRSSSCTRSYQCTYLFIHISDAHIYVYVCIIFDVDLRMSTYRLWFFFFYKIFAHLSISHTLYLCPFFSALCQILLERYRSPILRY